MKFYVRSVKYWYNVNDILDHYDIPNDLYKKDEIEFEIPNGRQIEYRLVAYFNCLNDFMRFVESVGNEVIITASDETELEVPILTIYDDYIE